MIGAKVDWEVRIAPTESDHATWVGKEKKCESYWTWENEVSYHSLHSDYIDSTSSVSPFQDPIALVGVHLLSIEFDLVPFDDNIQTRANKSIHTAIKVPKKKKKRCVYMKKNKENGTRRKRSISCWFSTCI